MGPLIRLALADLVRRFRLMLALGLMVALTVMMVMLLDGYIRSVDVRFQSAQPRLVVQEANTVGEFAGSRIPVSVADQLRARGASDPIAEIHAVTGSSGSDAVLIAGVEPNRYRKLDPYRLLSGRHLRSDESERTAIVGELLAERRNLGTGDVIRLRARDFRVVGVFELGTYLDDAAIVPLADAQALLGWGDDVSLYVMDLGEALAADDTLPSGLVVAGRGDVALVDEWGPLLDLMTASVRLLAVGATAVLAVALWRLAWLHRLDLGVLRLLGFPRRFLAAFLCTQAVILVVASTAAGATAAWFIAPSLGRTTLAVTIVPVVDGSVLVRAAAAAATVLVVAVSIPLMSLQRHGVLDLVQRDD